MIIDYTHYLVGDQWPSESGRAQRDPTGHYDPELKPVYDMPPQYAASALHKLVRWARDGSMTLEQEDKMERVVRSSTLGRLLARKALGIEDFELYQEHGVDRDALSAHHLARALVKPIMATVDLPVADVAKLAEGIALELSNEGFTTYKEA